MDDPSRTFVLVFISEIDILFSLVPIYGDSGGTSNTCWGVFRRDKRLHFGDKSRIFILVFLISVRSNGYHV